MIFFIIFRTGFELESTSQRPSGNSDCSGAGGLHYRLDRESTYYAHPYCVIPRLSDLGVQAVVHNDAVVGGVGVHCQVRDVLQCALVLVVAVDEDQVVLQTCCASLSTVISIRRGAAVDELTVVGHGQRRVAGEQSHAAVGEQLVDSVHCSRRIQRAGYVKGQYASYGIGCEPVQSLHTGSIT